MLVGALAAFAVVPGAAGASAEVAAASLSTAAVASTAELPAALTLAAPSAEALAGLRDCEASGDYTIVSYDGSYRGAYQFSQATWDSVASRWYRAMVGVDPAAAAPADQDAMARALYAEQGAAPWYACGAAYL
jgi:hypothetical protein